MGFIKKTINFENSKQMKEFLRLLRDSQYYPHEINVMKYVSGWKVLDKNNTFVMVVAKNGLCNSKETYISELNRIASKAKGSIKEKEDGTGEILLNEYKETQIIKHALEYYSNRPEATVKEKTQEKRLFQKYSEKASIYKQKYGIR